MLEGRLMHFIEVFLRTEMKVLVYLFLLIFVFGCATVEKGKKDSLKKPQKYPVIKVSPLIKRHIPDFEYLDHETGTKYRLRVFRKLEGGKIYIVTVMEPGRTFERLATPSEREFTIRELQESLSKTHAQLFEELEELRKLEQLLTRDILSKEIQIKERVIEDLRKEIAELKIHIKACKQEGAFLDTLDVYESMLREKLIELALKLKQLEVLKLKREEKIQEILY
jgi:hypothetical protein